MPHSITSTGDVAVNGSTVSGFLACPDDAAPHPAIVVIQEWWGLVPHIKDVAQRFAREDFVALAPDLYRGHTASEPDDARKLAMELQWPHAVKEILAAAHYLTSLPNVTPKKVASSVGVWVADWRAVRRRRMKKT